MQKTGWRSTSVEQGASWRSASQEAGRLSIGLSQSTCRQELPASEELKGISIFDLVNPLRNHLVRQQSCLVDQENKAGLWFSHACLRKAKSGFLAGAGEWPGRGNVIIFFFFKDKKLLKKRRRRRKKRKKKRKRKKEEEREGGREGDSFSSSSCGSTWAIKSRKKVSTNYSLALSLVHRATDISSYLTNFCQLRYQQISLQSGFHSSVKYDADLIARSFPQSAVHLHPALLTLPLRLVVSCLSHHCHYDVMMNRLPF